MTSRRSILLGLSLCGLALFSGCGNEPQVTRDNRRLIESILTAVSARNAAWLSTNEKLVEERKSAGQMDPAEYQTFREILDLAKQGKWDDATSRVYALRDAQRPTSDDLRRLESREQEAQPRPSKKRVNARF